MLGRNSSSQPIWTLRFIAGTYQFTISYFMFEVSVWGMSFMLAAIRKVTNNTWICILFHSCINSFMGVFLLKQNFSTVLTTGIEIILALASVIILSKNRKQQDSYNISDQA